MIPNSKQINNIVVAENIENTYYLLPNFQRSQVGLPKRDINIQLPHLNLSTQSTCLMPTTDDIHFFLIHSKPLPHLVLEKVINFSLKANFTTADNIGRNTEYLYLLFSH